MTVGDSWWKFGRQWARIGYQHFLAGGGRADRERSLLLIELDAALMRRDRNTEGETK